MYYTPYSVPFFFSAVILCAMGLYAWNIMRNDRVGIAFGAVLYLSAFWAVIQGMDMMTLESSLKIVWLKMRPPVIELLSISMLVLTLRYTMRDSWLSPPRLAALMLVPASTVILLWTESLHPLFRNGHWFWFHAVFCYGLHATALVLLIRSLSSARPLFYRPTVLIISGIFSSLLADILFSFGINPLEAFDSASSTMVVIGPLVAWVMFGHRMLDLVPIAHNLVAEKISDAIFVLNSENRIVDLNQAAQRMLGLESSAALGYPADRVLTWGNLFERYGDEESGRHEIITEEDGTQKYYDVSISPIVSDQKKVLGRLILLHDITELRRSQEATEEANRAKSAFLANTSHEIRTPMHAIMGFTDLLLDTGPTPEQKAYLEIVKASSETLLYILNDIMDASKIEAGKMELEEIDFDVRGLIESSLRPLSLQAGTRNLRLECTVDPGMPGLVRGDPVRLKQVLVNLLNNAVKFTDQGEVTLTVEMAPPEGRRREGEGTSDLFIFFAVRDTGIGIAEEKQKKIFQSFTQADNTITRRYGGTGLGLSISSELVKMMGGELKVQSSPGKGSSFSFTARFRRSSETEAAPVPGTAPVSMQPSSMNILLVEDTAVSRTLTVRLLEKRGHRVTTARDGVEALARLEREFFDLVLMDDRMPVMDGCEAARTIRDAGSRVLRHDVPIIALTAHATAEDRNRCLAAGMNTCLSKPLASDQLMAAVERYALTGSGPLSARQPSAQPCEGPLLKTAVSSLNLRPKMRREILDWYAGDEKLVDEVLELFKEEIPSIVNKVRDALAAGDVALLELHAHSCKSAAGSVGFASFASLASLVEQAAKNGDLVAAGLQVQRLEQELRQFLQDNGHPSVS